MKIFLSAIIIAKNAEDKIVDCLKSLEWVDEIVVIDNGSTDNTVKIAQSFKAKVFEKKGAGYSNLRNEGLKRSKGEWVFYVDTDERVDDKLKDEILSVLASKANYFDAYVLPRRNIVLRRELKHGGFWPDYVKRIFRRKVLKGWRGELHEEPVLKANAKAFGYLKNPILHLKEKSLSEMVEKTNVWSEIEARLMYESGHPKMNILRFVSACLREFYYRMIRKMAFLDGTEGIIFAIYQVYSRFITYAKLWEMQTGSQNSKFKMQN